MVNTTVIEQLVKRVFHRILARVRKTGSGDIVPPKTSTTHCFPPISLPLDLLETIIAYVIYDARTLCACTMTCRSWYIAAVPHLHHAPTMVNSCPDETKFRWFNPVQYMHMLGLLPLVKEFRPNALQLFYPASIFCVNQCPDTRNQDPGLKACLCSGTMETTGCCSEHYGTVSSY